MRVLEHPGGGPAAPVALRQRPVLFRDLGPATRAGRSVAPGMRSHLGKRPQRRGRRLRAGDESAGCRSGTGVRVVLVCCRSASVRDASLQAGARPGDSEHHWLVLLASSVHAVEGGRHISPQLGQRLPDLRPSCAKTRESDPLYVHAQALLHDQPSGSRVGGLARRPVRWPAALRVACAVAAFPL